MNRSNWNQNPEEDALPPENHYADLSDYENMIDEVTIEPDFYIDRAEPAVFVPDPEGHDKVTMLVDREELFDFNAEVEPILQVLIGRTLELSKIEVIEDYEQE